MGEIHRPDLTLGCACSASWPEIWPLLPPDRYIPCQLTEFRAQLSVSIIDGHAAGPAHRFHLPCNAAQPMTAGRLRSSFGANSERSMRVDRGFLYWLTLLLDVVPTELLGKLNFES